MTKTAQQNEQMEYRVIESNFFDAINDRACRVSQPPCKQPEQSFRGQVIDQGFDGKNDNPAHEHIHCRGNKVVFTREEHL